MKELPLNTKDFTRTPSRGKVRPAHSGSFAKGLVRMRRRPVPHMLEACPSVLPVQIRIQTTLNCRAVSIVNGPMPALTCLACFLRTHPHSALPFSDKHGNIIQNAQELSIAACKNTTTDNHTPRTWGSKRSLRCDTEFTNIVVTGFYAVLTGSAV